MELPFKDYEIADDASGLALIAPRADLVEAYREACEETWEHIHDRYILSDPAKYSEWKSTLLKSYDDRQRGVNLPEGYYPSVTLWAVIPGSDGQDTYVGSVNVRIEQDSDLVRYGGTFGFYVRYRMRRRGLGHAIARLGLEAAIRLGCDPIVTTCQESNAASMAVNKRLASVRQERDLVDIYGERQHIWRFWFSN